MTCSSPLQQNHLRNHYPASLSLLLCTFPKLKIKQSQPCLPILFFIVLEKEPSYHSMLATHVFKQTLLLQDQHLLSPISFKGMVWALLYVQYALKVQCSQLVCFLNFEGPWVLVYQFIRLAFAAANPFSFEDGQWLPAEHNFWSRGLCFSHGLVHVQQALIESSLLPS